MWSPIVLSTLLTLFVPSLVSAAATPAHLVDGAALVGRDTDLLDCYDYIIVGGGASGLTVANRLSADRSVKVLVIEAGDLAYGEEHILVPYMVNGMPFQYYWYMPSVPMAGINNRSSPLFGGKVVGGGTAVNGMFNPRGSRADYDIWKELGNPGWGFDDLLPYFKKSETFTPPSSELANDFGITYDMKYHGTSGPIQSSYPPFLYPAVKLFLNAIKQIGSHVPKDYASGDALGAFWVPNLLDPVNKTRSYARTAYYDTVKSRSNLHLLANNQVTQITFSGKTATGVKFSAGSGQTVQSVTASKEIIMAAGAAHTPQLLQLSGVGPKTMLQSFGINVISDLPGVGANFHDHPALFTAGAYNTDMNPSPSNGTNTSWLADQYALYQSSRQGIYTTAQSNSAAFLPLNEITSQANTDSIINKLKNQNPKDYFPAGTDSAIIAGWKAERDLLIKYMKNNQIAVAEFTSGSSASFALGLMKPFSRGSLTLSSTNAFDSPVVDFGTFRNPLDVDVAVEMVKTWRKILQTPAMQPLSPVTISPADSVTSDADIAAFIRQNIGASFSHPVGSAAMMAKSLGGVVGSDLKVYGVNKLSIVDASIIPVVPSTHLTSTMYAIAEKAADIIKARNWT